MSKYQNVVICLLYISSEYTQPNRYNVSRRKCELIQDKKSRHYCQKLGAKNDVKVIRKRNFRTRSKVCN